MYNFALSILDSYWLPCLCHPIQRRHFYL